jgi:hypothetical protein
MQLRGNYTETKTLDFQDTRKVGAYAKESVERLYHYGIMGARSGKNFEGEVIGTRAETAKFLYRMFESFEEGPLANKSYKDMTVEELKQAYPQYNHVIVQREWKPEMKIEVVDMMELYHKEINGHLKQFADVWTPEKWFGFKYPGYVHSAPSIYIDYPMREVIAYNGQAYKDSPFMAKDFSVTESSVYNQMPSQPEQEGQFLIDIHRYDDDFVVYRHEDVKWDALGKNPIEKERAYPIGNEYIVDLYTSLKYATGVTMARGGLEIAYDGQKIVLENGSNKASVNGREVTLGNKIIVENGRAYGPIREIVERIGLYTRVSHQFKRFEIANFPLEHKVGLWLE